MTVDEIAQKIFEERYADPKHPEIAMYLRDGMVREVVQRALELAIGDHAFVLQSREGRLRQVEGAIQIAADLVEARHARNTARGVVTAWVEDASTRGGVMVAETQAPSWQTYVLAEEAWTIVLAKLDAWIAGEEHP